MTCERCGRNVSPWLLRRADLCSPKYWGNCIRQFEDVARTTQEKAQRKQWKTIIRTELEAVL